MRMKFWSRKFLLFRLLNGVIFCVFFINNSYAEPGRQNNSVAQYKKLLEAQQKEFQIQRQIIAEQGKELEQLRLRLDALVNQSVENKQLPAKQAANKPQIVVAKNDNEPSESPNKLPSKPVGQAPPGTAEKPRPPEIPRLSDTVGGVLTKKGNIVVEPSLYYAYTSNDRVFLDAFTYLPAIAIGLIDLRAVKRHSVIGTLGARYGVSDRLELEFRVPYVYRHDTQRSRPVSIGAGADETFNASGNDIGDLEFAGRYQLNSGTGGWPIFVGNIVATAPTGKSPFDIEYVQAQGVPGAKFPTELPTGAGYFSFQPSITALYPTDPAVFFGNLSYNYNAETSTSVGKIQPGGAVGLSFGMGFGINERSSYSLGYSHKHVFNSRINGETIQGSTLDIGQLLIGYSFKYSPRTTFNLSLGIGTTTDAQDVTLNFRVPMTFGLFDS
ncbi:transporter [Candidatus Methylobacter oryzae]|uniref:Transporter n=1 Tax=Candidatus Methylobacter oryzae TaxID=2497749 RepID=A0ABY3CBR7_9GAMM|nr:transporter [Candidatus Methylobacter oryzae]TRW95885.1 transporter [Candidatus Methylobacter oryzae]